MCTTTPIFPIWDDGSIEKIDKSSTWTTKLDHNVTSAQNDINNKITNISKPWSWYNWYWYN